ncbi:hypothetical protein GCM10020000_52340 [Streptomyces olivoverticillatus]
MGSNTRMMHMIARKALTGSFLGLMFTVAIMSGPNLLPGNSDVHTGATASVGATAEGSALVSPRDDRWN